MKFLRRTWNRYSKLGRKRKNKQVWRKPKGRDNKMREKRKGYPSIVSIGYGSEKNSRETIRGKTPVNVKNIKDLNKITAKDIGIMGNVGKKKRIELAKKAKEKGIEFYNLNVENFLKEVEKKVKKEEPKQEKKKVETKEKKQEAKK